MDFALRDVVAQIRDRRQACKLGEADFHHECHRPQRRMAHCDGLRQRAHCRTATLQRMSTAEFHFALSLQSAVTMSPPLVLLLRANIKIFSFSNPLGSTGTQALCAPSVLIKLKSCCSTQQWCAQQHTASKSHVVCLQIDCVYPDPSLWSELSQKFGFIGLYISSVLPILPCHVLWTHSNRKNILRKGPVYVVSKLFW